MSSLTLLAAVSVSVTIEPPSLPGSRRLQRLALGAPIGYTPIVAVHLPVVPSHRPRGSDRSGPRARRDRLGFDRLPPAGARSAARHPAREPLRQLGGPLGARDRHAGLQRVLRPAARGRPAADHLAALDRRLSRRLLAARPTGIRRRL